VFVIVSTGMAPPWRRIWLHDEQDRRRRTASPDYLAAIWASSHYWASPAEEALAFVLQMPA